MANCGTCGTALDPSRALYDETGTLTCDRCLELARVRGHHVQSDRNARAAGYANVAFGVGAFFFPPLALVAFAVLAGVIAYNQLSKARGTPIPDAGSRLFVAALGAILGAASWAVRFFMPR